VCVCVCVCVADLRGFFVLINLRCLSHALVTDGTRLYANAVHVGEQLVGACVLRSARETCMQLRSHYNIEEFILFSHYMPGEHAVLHHFLLNPIFERLAKYVLREAMRKVR
jgi:hypothetical protein